MKVERVVYKWYEKLAIKIIKTSPIPKHVAIILDGNRRFAKKSNISIQDGHITGGKKLIEYIYWCMDLGVQETTVYAFSIENFKRSEKEVNDLMEMFIDLFGQLGETAKEDEIRIRFIGNIKLLPAELQKLMAKYTIATEGNSKLFLNVALAYASQEEITNSIQTILKDGGENLLPSDINEELLRQCLYTGNCMSEPDFLIRSSGNTRISDFLMWQISSSVICFTKTLWPALTTIDFILGILYYQRSVANLSQYREHLKNQMKLKEDLPERVQNFLRKVEARQRNFILKLADEQ